MAVTRLDGDERRKAIVKAAVPLFARNGFAGTTTRELAEAAHISEALLFKHFPSKQLLYREILQLGCEGDPVLERLATLAPSTATLVRMIHFMVAHFLLGADIDQGGLGQGGLDQGGVDQGEGDRVELDTRLRLILYSCLEDGDYARELFETVFECVHPLFAASLAAAAAAGDLVPGPIAPGNGFWFGHHVAAMIAFTLLPGRSCAPYEGSIEHLVEQASWFVLRGLGLRDEAIASALAAGKTLLETEPV
jgi:AcrR family transcriptional regulator